MKHLIRIIFLTLILGVPAIAQEQVIKNIELPEEYEGYALFYTFNNNGKKILVQYPVKYKLNPSIIPQDNDENYQYRSYRAQLLSRQNQSAAHKPIDENQKINSAEYYPLYFN